MQKAPQSARQQWILIGMLVIVIIGGAAGGFLLIHHKRPAPRPVVQFTTEDDSRLRNLLDEGKYEEVVAEAGRLTGAVGKHATVLRYRALAQLLLERPGEAVASANDALAAGAKGPEAAVVNAAKALAALKDRGQQAGTAKEAAQQAMVQAGRDPQAGLLANVAFAAVLREELERQTRRQGEGETGSNDSNGGGPQSSRRVEKKNNNGNNNSQGNGGNPQISQITQINNNNSNGNITAEAQRTQRKPETNSNDNGNNISHGLTRINADNNNSKGNKDTARAEARTLNAGNDHGPATPQDHSTLPLRGPATAQDHAARSAEQVARIRQALEPIYAISPAAPKQAWLAGIWRRGLAMYGECGVFAGQAGDAFTEAQVLAILQRCCPADVWACELKIPQRAARVARQVQEMAGKVDEHARAGLYTAVAVLYESAGEPGYADAAYGRAMRAWQRVLSTTEEWSGEKTQIANGDQVRLVGAEYFAYRHCLERIAVFRANRWSAWIAAGRVTREAALGACDHPLFRAVVRLRVDKQVAPGQILREAKVENGYWPVVADVIERWPAGATAEWAKARAQAVRAAAMEPVVAAAADTQPAVAGVQVAEAPGKVAGAAQSAPVQPYAGMTDIASGVGGGRSLARRPMSDEEKVRVDARPQPVPDFGWGQAAARGRQAGEGQQDAAAGPADAMGMGDLGDLPAPSSQPNGPAQARAQALAKEINTQLAAGNVDKALDAYFQLQSMAGSDPQTSALTRSMMEMFSQSIGGLDELQDLLGELDGKPKKQAPRQQPPAPQPQQQPQQRQAEPQKAQKAQRVQPQQQPQQRLTK